MSKTAIDPEDIDQDLINLLTARWKQIDGKREEIKANPSNNFDITTDDYSNYHQMFSNRAGNFEDIAQGIADGLTQLQIIEDSENKNSQQQVDELMEHVELLLKEWATLYTADVPEGFEEFHKEFISHFEDLFQTVEQAMDDIEALGQNPKKALANRDRIKARSDDQVEIDFGHLSFKFSKAVELYEEAKESNSSWTVDSKSGESTVNLDEMSNFLFLPVIAGIFMLIFEVTYAANVFFVGVILALGTTPFKLDTKKERIRFILVTPFFLGVTFYFYGFPYWGWLMGAGLVGSAIASQAYPKEKSSTQ